MEQVKQLDEGPKDTDNFLRLDNDSVDGILTFLSVAEIINLGATCKGYLRGSVKNIFRRREQLLHPTNVSSSRICQSINGRMECLWKALPSGHHSKALASQFRRSMSGVIENETVDSSVDVDTVQVLIEKLRKYSAPFRLHFQAATQAFQMTGTTVDSDLASVDYDFNQYVGDLLTLFFLLPHVSTGALDYGPSVEDLFRKTVSIQKKASEHMANGYQPWSPRFCYSIWMMTHFLVLHNARFSSDTVQALNLGDDTFHTTKSGFQVSVLQPTVLKAYREVDVGLRQLRDRASIKLFRIVSNSFGPLGPAFRGRDNVTTQSVDYGMHYDIIVYSCVDGEMNEGMIRFLNQYEAIEFLRYMMREARINRPMTVVPPVIRFAADVQVP